MESQPVLDSNLVYIWDYYLDIKKGCDTVGYLEIDAFQRVAGVDFTPWEASMILELDKVRKANG